MQASEQKDDTTVKQRSKVQSELKVRETKALMRSVAEDLDKEDGNIEELINDKKIQQGD